MAVWDTFSTLGGIVWSLFHEPIMFAPAIALIYLIIYRRKVLKPLRAGAVKNMAHNMGLLAFNTLIVVFLFGGLNELSTYLYEELGLPHLTEAHWSPMWIIVPVLIALVLLDLTNYAVHRLMHTKWLWGVHALHHSDTHMTWTTTYRMHFIELAIMSVFFAVFTGWLYFPTEAVIAAGFIRGAWSKFIHCDVPWSFGPVWGKVLASPNFHRWHHADNPESYGKNLCDTFPIWDVLFGTYYEPGLCTEKLGVSDAPKDFIGGQLWFIKYNAKLLREDLNKKPAVEA